MTTSSDTFRRTGTATARRLTSSREWTTQAGDSLHGEAGDWLVTDSHGGERTVGDGEFRDLYEDLPDGTYSRKGTVTARQTDAPETVETLEGTATARPGDWVVTAPDGSSWPVPDEVFRAGYAKVVEGE